MDKPRNTPEHISQLAQNEVFVFGSNASGLHYGGAARFAWLHFGAEWGVGEGLTGQCYALPTMEGAEAFQQAVGRFIQFAKQHSEYTFLVTPVGCGIAGYDPKQVAPWFDEARQLSNVVLPSEFNA